MPELAEKSESAVNESGKSFRLRFSLLGMLVLITCIAAIFGYLGYYRPGQAIVSYQVATLPTKQFDALGIRFNTIEGSPYRWAEVSDFDLSTFTPEDNRTQQPFSVQETPISSWPIEAASYADSRFVNARAEDGRPMLGSEVSQFTGFMGTRKAGLNLQLRLELDVSHHYPDFSNAAKDYLPQLQTVEGKIFYEGRVPAGDLLFIAPIGNDVYHAVLVSARPVDKQSGTTTKPNP
ncbi:hypothetical protein [Blastopirellula marina]|uniref:Uncharacterized protein n=1 Tax=Blastopirellula marina TaxID=124 RepID=A0A2S8GE38_9BACT|nr:hypothetical protein [Blastopirellula marina]PQO42727.1 hypothetical protein C5Y98_00810 [Blastopirellula marina]PTL46493.1 hypothetical protein C5Y97_00810 [Blastopirellula marina]